MIVEAACFSPLKGSKALPNSGLIFMLFAN